MTADRTKIERLGELLMARGMLTQAQLETALRLQQGSNEFLGVLLVRQGYVTESGLYDVLSEQFGMARVPLEPHTIDWELAAQFPPILLIDNRCFPIARDEHAITVAVANPLDAWIVSEVENWARGDTLKLVLATPREIAAMARELQRRMLQRLRRSIQES